jgi:chorismate mutase
MSRGRWSPVRDPGYVGLMSDTAPLSDLRDAIDALDDEILRLLSERATLVVKVGEIKRAASLPVFDPERERVILERLARNATPPLDGETVQRVFERIIDESRRIEQNHVAQR